LTNDENHPTRSALTAHLSRWGLRKFDSDDAYFAWQCELFSPSDVTTLHQLIANKQAPGSGVLEETAFYDATAQPHIVPALYSQRYQYYLAIGPRIVARIPSAGSVLDFGCGIGLLTTFYAQLFPHVSFLGIDRSPASIAYARQRAKDLKLTNIEFDCVDLDRRSVSGRFDLIIATHALLQAEHDPGIPSTCWQTFDRSFDEQAQTNFEQRTGLVPRLDHLLLALVPEGSMIVFEKTRLLARRIPFQRALAGRRLRLLESPESIRYSLVEEVAEDGPLYVLGREERSGSASWDEAPEEDGAAGPDLDALGQHTHDGDEPLYENHDPSAQRMWAQLPDRLIINEHTTRGRLGRELHAELGTTKQRFAYLYVANTFDQRQLVLIEQARLSVLESYYRDIVSAEG
jgi:SAM-dependent methyltransferase